eukprot:COSAG01_NODE_402_length_17510_cov_6.871575_19_plen_190_part_00
MGGRSLPAPHPEVGQVEEDDGAHDAAGRGDGLQRVLLADAADARGGARGQVQRGLQGLLPRAIGGEPAGEAASPGRVRPHPGRQGRLHLLVAVPERGGASEGGDPAQARPAGERRQVLHLLRRVHEPGDVQGERGGDRTPGGGGVQGALGRPQGLGVPGAQAARVLQPGTRACTSDDDGGGGGDGGDDE